MFLKSGGQKTEALNVEEKNKTAYFQEKYFVLAVKIKAMKITKAVASSSRTNVRTNPPPSENSAGQWFNNYKNPSYHYNSQLVFWWNVSFRSGITSLPTSYSGVSHYLIMSQCRDGISLP